MEPVLPVPHAFIFGGGHISKSLSKVATLAGFATVVVDDRETFANRERFPEAAEVHAAEYEEVFPELAINETSYVIVVTRGHRDDMRVLQLAVATPARYIAMIGSKRKVLNVVRELEKEGLPRAAFERIHAPMGLDIGAISPEEIAISVAAEMIAVRRHAASNWRALSMSVFAGESREAALSQVNSAGLILAAGESRRMGFPKALLHIPRETFLDTLVELFAARCSPVIVVLGAGADEIRAARPRPATFVVNRDYQRGQTSSMQCGLRAVPPEAEGVLFTLVDHPAVAPDTFDALLAARGPRQRSARCPRAALPGAPRPSDLVFARTDPGIPGAPRERRGARCGAQPRRAKPSSWTSTTPASSPTSTIPMPTARLTEPKYEDPPAHCLQVDGAAAGAAAGGRHRGALRERRPVRPAAAGPLTRSGPPGRVPQHGAVQPVQRPRLFGGQT